MELIITRCCGLDVHKASVTACARLVHDDGRVSELVETFGTTTPDLLALRDWLKGLEVTHVAMEATGVYWKCVYYLLEDDFELMLVNARHIKHVPGRKTDTIDACWIAQLAARPRALAGQLRAAEAYPPIARPDALSQGANRGAYPRRQSPA